MKNNKNKLGLAAIISGILSLSNYTSAVEISQEQDKIIFNSIDNNQYTLKVLAPNREIYNFKVEGNQIILSASQLGESSFPSGQYKFELSPNNQSGNLGAKVRSLNDPEVSNEYKESFKNKQQLLSGVFSIQDNSLVNSHEIEGGMLKDVVHLDDLIVDGSACIGFDCVNGESFGFDTLRLKENNLRIKFEDTSVAGSFPGNDWQLTANDSANGGANKFSIDDITGGRTPFTVEARAPSHSLYVDDGGRIGNGTSTPSTEIHTVDGDTPTLRLEQDGSSGFAPQTWDLAGNETNFFIRDVSNGSQLPFRIRPDAPTSSIDVKGGTGNVGFGTASPTAPIHVLRSNGTAQVLVSDTSSSVAARGMFTMSNNGGSYITMTNTQAGTGSWYLTHENSAGNAFNFTHDLTGGGQAMKLTTDGNMTLKGTLTTGGVTCGGGCDFVFDKDYELPTIEEHAAEMWKNNYLPTVGPTIENEPFNLTEKTGRILNELEKAHIYIDQLNNDLKDKDVKLSSLSSQFAQINNQLDTKNNELNEMKSQFLTLSDRLSVLENK